VISKHITERWTIFKKQKAESFLSHKGDIKIIIYGAYNPPGDGEHFGEKERLIKLRDYLRNDGYKDTYIVADFPTDDESISPNLDKSFECLIFADLNILVFTCRGKTGSVTRELNYAIENSLLSKCRVFEEVHNSIYAMETLLREELRTERYLLVSVEYENDTDLYEHVLGDVVPFLRRFAIKLR
jgi:hypothetical protein